ncbi:MAG: M24 family metallopeptidase [bacterium]
MQSARLDKLRKLLESRDLDAALITDAKNRRYFSGFTGSAGVLLITKDRALLLTDFRYLEQAASQAELFEIVDCTPNNKLLDLFQELKIKNLGFENRVMTVQEYQELQNEGTVFISLNDELDKMRWIKDEKELACIRQAASIADQAFSHILKFLKVGLTEQEVALELEYTMKKAGAEDLSFASIVAAGEHSSLPHARPGKRKIAYGDFVKMDFGALYQGYCSDMTRTVVMGQASDRQKEIYNLVLTAQKAALDLLKPGMMTDKVDSAARTIIAENGYGEYFGHGLGHSLGLFIHEEPRLSPSCQVLIQPGMLFTVEPGIYLPGFGGVRIEDLVLVTDSGIDNLTSSPKELIVLA